MAEPPHTRVTPTKTLPKQKQRKKASQQRPRCLIWHAIAEWCCWKNKNDREQEQTTWNSFIYLWAFDLKHLSLCQDAQVGWFCHHPAVLVPGDGGRRYSVGLTLQSYRFTNEHIHHHGRVPTTVPDTRWNWKAEERGRHLLSGRSQVFSEQYTQCGCGLTKNGEVDVFVSLSCCVHGHTAVLSPIRYFCFKNL